MSLFRQILNLDAPTSPDLPVDPQAPLPDLAAGQTTASVKQIALALGARTFKLKFGHRGANHPVKQLDNGRVEITSQNHGFAVDAATLPKGVKETHVSLFDGSNCGIELEGINQ